MPDAQDLGFGTKALRRDGEYVLFRRAAGRYADDELVLATASEQASPRSVERLQHEYSLRDSLDPDWSAKPLTLTHEHGRSLLVLADPGGELLSGFIDRRWEPGTFLRVAIGMSAALGRVHAQGLIHKDVKPDHVLIDPATGAAWLTGFGIASRLARERQLPDPLEAIVGTLAYMAPEQTGRMNRSVDARSDLYALGVTFYQMLTGALPFTAADPMELVHCHIARAPVPPIERVPGIPAALSAVVVKLLAKTAEERYQTAAGVASDLKRCLAQWETEGQVEDFVLGGRDRPDRFLIPEKLYGREREVDALLASFDRMVKSGRPELVLVSGYSGIGKSAVVNELHKPLVLPHGLFASGKFDQYKRDIPYSTVAQAFQNLIRGLLAKSDDDLAPWRNALGEALGPNGRLVTDLIPELALIIGQQPPVPELPPQAARGRFQLVFRRFIGVFARPEHPLALFLDDLQWLDAATLDLIEDLLTQPDVKNLMLIGAYRNNEVDPSHPLARKLQAMREAGASLQDIVLAPLTRECLEQLIGDSLHCGPEQAAQLAALVHAKTTGNPFFSIHFLSALSEEGLLTFDHVEGRWSWDLNRIHAKGYTDNVVDLMVGKLTRLAPGTQDALKQLACLGNSAAFTTVRVLYQDSMEQMHAQLAEAVMADLVLHEGDSYRFLHDRVQEAAYSLIPQELRAEAHLRIGRLMVSHTPSDKLEEVIFEIVNQLNRGAHLITSIAERERLAELNLNAGRRARMSTAYTSALAYLRAGRELLTDEPWKNSYQLVFSIEYLLAECEFLTADTAAAENRLSTLAERATSAHDTALVTRLRVTLYTVVDRSDRAVEVFLEYLRGRGTDWSPHPTKEDVSREYDQIWSLLGNRNIEQLVDLPPMTDRDVRDVLDVFIEIAAPAFFVDVNLYALVCCRMVSLSLEHGNSDGSCYAYVQFSVVAGFHFGNYQAAFRFGKLGYDLVEERGLRRYQTRTLQAFGALVVPWTKHVRTGLEIQRRCFNVANGIGDVIYAAFCRYIMNTNLLAAGDPLAEVQREAETGLEFATSIRFGHVIDYITAHLGLIRTLRGLTAKFGVFNDERFDELRFERHLASDRVLALPQCWYWIRKMQARFFAGDYPAAIETSLNAERLLWVSPAFFENAEYHFYSALARAAAVESAPDDLRQRHLEALAAHQKQVAIWAQHCPETFENRLALIDAEIARIEGRELDAARFYEAAIRSARENGFVQNEALAHELGGRFYLRRGFEDIGNLYLRKARRCYLRWGADGKVRQLDETYPGLREEERMHSSTNTITTSVEGLDLATVIKVSQALSGEIVLERMLDSLMRIAIEHAGAGRGLLILARRGEHSVVAEVTADAGTVDVQVRNYPVAAASLPQSVLHYVLRTHESVILDDAAAQGPFTSDPYVRSHRARSVLCLPLLKQARLMGVLYLENRLAARVFTPTRIAVLNVLASQAAISLENAGLYSDLQKENAERRQSEQALRESEDRFARAVAGSYDGVWDIDFVGRTAYFSPRTRELSGLPPGPEVMPWDGWAEALPLHPEDRPRRTAAFEAHLSGKAPAYEGEFRLLQPDGVYRWRHLHGVCVRDASGKPLRMAGSISDVDASRRAEDALRESEQRYERAMEASDDGFWDWNPATDTVYTSPRLLEIYGFAPGTTFNGHEDLVRSIPFHPEDRLQMARAIAEHFAGKRARLDIQMRFTRDGETRWVHLTGMVARDASGTMERWTGTVRDVTERKRAEEELEAMERKLRQAQRLESMGTFAGGIAHDFNNILGAILGFSEMARRAAPKGSRLAGDLQSIMTAGERGRALVSRLLTFSRSVVGERVPVHVERVAREALDVVSAKLPPGVSVQAELHAGRAAILGDATQVHQVVANLATNAIHAMPEGGTLRVGLAGVAVEAPRAATIGELVVGEYVVLTVADTGAGIPPEIMERIFDPFFTTKEAGTGTGLGLSLVHGIVTELGGCIDLVTKVGAGTTFTVYLPRSGEAPEAEGGTELAVPRGKGQRVLVVDDEEPLVTIATRTLEELGYAPVGFTSSSDALAALRADPQRFDALITDERMPGVSGSALIREVRGIRGSLPVVLMSGYLGPTADKVRESGLFQTLGMSQKIAAAIGADEVLQKPLSVRDLATSLARVLRL